MRMSDHDSDDVGAVSRRMFAGGAVAIVASALCPAIAPGEDKRNPSVGTDIGSKPEDLSVADWNEVRARYSNLLRVYGKRLSLEEKRKSVEILTTNQHMLASIRSFVVQNGDVSACTLRVYGPQRPSDADKQV